MHLRRGGRLIAIAILLIAAVQAGFAPAHLEGQNLVGEIDGVVKDATGAVIPITKFDPSAQAYLTGIINKTSLPNNPNDPQGLIANEQGFKNRTQTFIRIDRQVTAKLSIFIRYVDDPFHIIVPFGIRQTTGIPGVGTESSTAGGTTYLGHAAYVLNSSTVLEGDYSYMASWLTAQPIGYLASASSPDIRPTLSYLSTLARGCPPDRYGRSFDVSATPAHV